MTDKWFYSGRFRASDGKFSPVATSAAVVKPSLGPSGSSKTSDSRVAHLPDNSQCIVFALNQKRRYGSRTQMYSEKRMTRKRVTSDPPLRGLQS